MVAASGQRSSSVGVSQPSSPAHNPPFWAALVPGGHGQCLCLHPLGCSEHVPHTVSSTLTSITCFHGRCLLRPLRSVYAPVVRSLLPAPHWAVFGVFIVSGVSALLNASHPSTGWNCLSLLA